jgi:hypothetical protein
MQKKNCFCLVVYCDLTAGIGRISPGLFLNCPYKKPVILKIWKNVFLGKWISYHLSLGDCFKKSFFHIVLGAFLGHIQKISSVFFILRHSEAPAQGRYALLYSQSVFRDPSEEGEGERTPNCREFKNLPT